MPSNDAAYLYSYMCLWNQNLYICLLGILVAIVYLTQIMALDIDFFMKDIR